MQSKQHLVGFEIAAFVESKLSLDFNYRDTKELTSRNCNLRRERQSLPTCELPATSFFSPLMRDSIVYEKRIPFAQNFNHAIVTSKVSNYPNEFPLAAPHVFFRVAKAARLITINVRCIGGSDAIKVTRVIVIADSLIGNVD